MASLKDSKAKKITESTWDGFSGLYPTLLKNTGETQDKWTKLIDLSLKKKNEFNP